jgi:hypothetical protein
MSIHFHDDEPLFEFSSKDWTFSIIELAKYVDEWNDLIDEKKKILHFKNGSISKERKKIRFIIYSNSLSSQKTFKEDDCITAFDTCHKVMKLYYASNDKKEKTIKKKDKEQDTRMCFNRGRG